jgi:hypothetical protein
MLYSIKPILVYWVTVIGIIKMKYIITEKQKVRIEEVILKFFDDRLTPEEGWESHEYYEKELEENSGEVFFHLTDDPEWDLSRENHMWYSICNNENLSEPLPEGHCPVITLPNTVFDALDGYFGVLWRKLFRRWFMFNTGLLVVQIDKI